jgi:hypothetical protein
MNSTQTEFSSQVASNSFEVSAASRLLGDEAIGCSQSKQEGQQPHVVK